MDLPETATINEAPALLRAIAQSLQSGTGAAQLDAGALKTLDTSAVALLLHARRLAQASGRRFEVLNAPAKLAKLAQLYGVAELLSLSSSAPRDTAT